MNFAVDPNHVYHTSESVHQTVFLDGVRQPDCIVASESEGWITRYKKDVYGRYLRGTLEETTQTVRGKVEIKVVEKDGS